MKKFFIAVAVCVFLLLIASAGGMWWWFSAQKPLTSSDTAISCQIEVPKGTTLRAVADNLKHQGLIRSNTVFYYQGRLDKVQIKRGHIPCLRICLIMILLHCYKPGPMPS